MKKNFFNFVCAREMLKENLSKDNTTHDVKKSRKLKIFQN